MASKYLNADGVRRLVSDIYNKVKDKLNTLDNTPAEKDKILTANGDGTASWKDSTNIWAGKSTDYVEEDVKDGTTVIFTDLDGPVGYVDPHDFALPNGVLSLNERVTTKLQNVEDNVTDGFLGTKNIYIPLAKSETKPTGITVTENGDVTYTLEGYSSGTTLIELGAISLEVGKTYKLVGCPRGGSVNSIILKLNIASQTTEADYGNGYIFTVDSSTVVNPCIRIAGGFTAQGQIIKPMIVEDTSLTYDDFMPSGGLSNRGITKELPQKIAFPDYTSLSWVINSGIINNYVVPYDCFAFIRINKENVNIIINDSATPLPLHGDIAIQPSILLPMKKGDIIRSSDIVRFFGIMRLIQ